MNLTFPHYIESLLAASWLPQVMTVLAVVVGLNIVASIVLRYVEKLTARTSTVWDEALVRAARSPVTLVLWTVGTAYAIQIVDAHLGLTVPDMVGQVMRSLIIVALAWFLLRLIGQVSRGVLARSEAEGQGIDRTTVDALSKLGRVTVLVVALLVVLQHLGFSVSGVLAFGGIGGIAVGFAAKDMLANFFGGLTIYLDRPFTVGEWIRSPDKQIEGTVEYIGWRHTRVRAFNKNPIYVPNALFTSIVVENPTRMTNRRIKETIGVRYDDIGKVAPIVADVKAMLYAHPEIDTNATIIVNFNQYGPSSLDIMIYTFTRTKEWVRFHEIKQDVLLRIGAIIGSHGAQIAFPTQTLYVASVPDEAGAGSSGAQA
ncbi:MAG: mechanosensitive ion channel family protein [Thiobacillus sp.]|nr:mechanosensitive ion channel family protein [Thiobacillus sp.]